MNDCYDNEQSTKTTIEEKYFVVRSGRDCCSSPDRAKKRWKLLANALLIKNGKQRKKATTSTITTKCQTLGLLQFENETYDEISGKFSCRAFFPNLTDVSSSSLKVNLQLLTNSTGLHDLIGFDNTGNVRLWPSEEILTYFCLKNKTFFQNKLVCELGAGMTGLASMFLAKCGLPKKILVTDGNEKSAENLKFMVEINRCRGGGVDIIESRRLLWGNSSSNELIKFKSYFDVILAADCFFFKNADELLLQTVDHLLKPKGNAIFFAPLRNGTFRRFVDAVRRSKSFTVVKISDDYFPEISSLQEQLLRDNCDKFDSVFPLMLQIEKLDLLENYSAPPHSAGVLVDDNSKLLKFPR